jgi:hypothetical protein
MHRLALLLLLSPLAAGATTGVSLDACRIESDYDLRLGREGITLRRDGGQPAEVRLAGRRLWIDGSEVALSARDRETVAAMQAEVDALLPEVRAIAIDAVGIAVAALTQVAGTLGGADGEPLARRMKSMEQAFVERLDAELAKGSWDSASMEAEIEALVAELAPQLAGNIAALAVKAALSGDEAAARDIERRAEAMERSLEAEMTQRSAALEARAEALCPRLERLDQLEEALELRLADGSRLDLVQR